MNAEPDNSLHEIDLLGTDISTFSEKKPAPTAPLGSDSVQTEKDLEFGLETRNDKAPADSSKHQTRRLVLVVVLLVIIAVAVAVAVGFKVASTQQNNANASKDQARSVPSPPDLATSMPSEVPATGTNDLASTPFPSESPSSIAPSHNPTSDLSPTAAPTLPDIWKEVGFETDFLASEAITVASSSLSTDGKVLAIGSLDNTTLFQGAVNVYSLTNGTNGSPEFSPIGQQLIGANPNDYFGISVALSGDGTVLAVGATQSGDDFDSVTTGGGYVTVFSFQEEDAVWVPRGMPVLPAGLNTSADAFGVDVALSRDGMVLAVLATNYYSVSAKPVGYAKVFRFNETSLEWDLVDTIDKWSYSGDLSMALSGDGSVLALGDTFEGNSGSIRTWSCDVETGCERLGQEITGDDYEDMIGSSVSLSDSGKILAVGSPGSYDCAWNTPTCVNVKVYLLVPGSDAAWVQVGDDLHGEMGFGSSLKMSGDGASLAVHVPVCDIEGGDCAYAGEDDYRWVVQTYRLSGTGEWLQEGSPVDGDLLAFSRDGSTIAALDSELVVASYRHYG